MTTEYTIYHNPRCSKSRKTLELLQGAGIEPKIIEYLKTPPSGAELQNILDKLNYEPRALIRHKEICIQRIGFRRYLVD